MSKSGGRLACLAVVVLALTVFHPFASNAQQAPVDVSISLAPYPAPGAPVRVTRVEMIGDDVRLELENNTASPVTAVYLQYDLYAPAGCTPEMKDPISATMVSADGKRVPGFISVDIPAYSRTSYVHKRIASYLGDSAVKAMKTRYAMAHVEVNQAAFADAEKKEWTNPAMGDRDALTAPGACAQYPWDSSIQRVEGFRSTPQTPEPATIITTLNGDPGVAYTCTLAEAYLTCPKAQ